jgi:hypothetical protein
MPAEEIKGEPGELIDRIITLLDNDALGEHMWYNVGRYAEMFLGGAALSRVDPDTGKEPAPGSVGELMRRGRQVVSREQWFELIRGRFGELVQSGMNEAFLVRSVRDSIRPLLDYSGPEISESERNRAETREHIQRMLEDPAELAAFRTLRADKDPSAEALSDDEVKAQLRRMVEGRLLRPMSADDVSDRWVALENWDRQTDSFLPDRVFSEWTHLIATRGWKR